MCVFGSFPQNCFPVYAVNDQHKAEACQDTGSCSEGSAGGTEFGMFGIVCRELLAAPILNAALNTCSMICEIEVGIIVLWAWK